MVSEGSVLICHRTARGLHSASRQPDKASPASFCWEKGGENFPATTAPLSVSRFQSRFLHEKSHGEGVTQQDRASYGKPQTS